MGLKLVVALLVAASWSVAPRPGQQDPTLLRDARAVLMVGLAGESLDPGTLFHLRDGGRAVVLLGRNVASTEQVRDLARQVSCATQGSYLLAVDHEPGRVQRLAAIIGPFPMTSDPSEMREASRDLSHELLRLGVTMDLAPVLDRSGSSPALTGRTFSEDPATVVEMGEALRRGLEESRVASVIKHFPGHGQAPSDPHLAVTEVNGPGAADLAPFQLAVALGARAVMVGHPIYSELDPESPASSSPSVYRLLRSWGFDGVAVTDALGMVGARDGRTVPETAVAALTAGADLLIVEDHDDREPVVAALVAAVQSGAVDRTRLGEAAHRVRRLAAWVDGFDSTCGPAWQGR